MENQQFDHIEQTEEQVQSDEQVQKRGRGRPRKDEVVVKPVKVKKVFKTHSTDYFKNYYNEKVKPLKQARKELKNKMKLEIEEARTKEITTTANTIINKIKNINNQDTELEKICQIMKLICKKFDIEVE